jgi:hypothetical protein
LEVLGQAYKLTKYSINGSLRELLSLPISERWEIKGLLLELWSLRTYSHNSETVIQDQKITAAFIITVSTIALTIHKVGMKKTPQTTSTLARRKQLKAAEI